MTRQLYALVGQYSLHNRLQFEGTMIRQLYALIGQYLTPCPRETRPFDSGTFGLDAGALNDVICSTAPPKNCFLHPTVELLFITVKMFGNWAFEAIGGAGGRELEQKMEVCGAIGGGGVLNRKQKSEQDEAGILELGPTNEQQDDG
ncbi:hypothetical protein DFH09DRAFT_1090080 [Mycena vulgaris]|nr:hypothetical protein DFH09DRAFT_1090080 [Mycena vulgaris]